MIMKLSEMVDSIGQLHLMITENRSGETVTWYSPRGETRRPTFVCGLMKLFGFLFIISGRKASNWEMKRMKFAFLVISHQVNPI